MLVEKKRSGKTRIEYYAYKYSVSTLKEKACRKVKKRVHITKNFTEK